MNKSAAIHHLYMNTQNHITAPSSLGLSVREGKVVVSSRDVAEKALAEEQINKKPAL